MFDVETLWADFARPIVSADDYINSLRSRQMNVFFMGERVVEPVDHPVIRPSINAMAETYRLAVERPELGGVHTNIGGCHTSRFLHVPTKPDDLVTKHEMQRELGRRTGTCFQRCVGLDAIGACHSITFDVDAEHNTDHHKRFPAFLRRAQVANIVIGGAMTDPKGDRSKPPHQQADPDLFLRVVSRDAHTEHRQHGSSYLSSGICRNHQTSIRDCHFPDFLIREGDAYAIRVVKMARRLTEQEHAEILGCCGSMIPVHVDDGRGTGSVESVWRCERTHHDGCQRGRSTRSSCLR